jgi:hypothetical protein
MAKHFGAGVVLGALIVGACWVGVSYSGVRASNPQASSQTPQTTPGVRSPDGILTVHYKLKGAGNVAHLEGVTAIDFCPGCIVVQYKQGPVQRGQVLFTDQTEDLHWLPSP